MASPTAERAFLGGLDMDFIRSGKPLPFSRVPLRGRTHPALAEAHKARFASIKSSRSLRASLAPVAAPASGGAALSRSSSASKQGVLSKAEPSAPSLLQMPRLASMMGDEIEDDPMTDTMYETIKSMSRSLDYEQLRMYGCSPGAAFGHPMTIVPPAGEGFRRGTVVHHLRDLYDLSVLPTRCCNKRVRLGAGKYLPLTEFLTIMIKQMRDSEGGVMRVDLQHTFPPAFDYLCLGLSGTPASVVRPQYRLKAGAQIAGALNRIDAALSTLLDVCTDKAEGDPIEEWNNAANALRGQACEVSSVV